MKILYIANIRLPTEKAHGIQIMKTCEALSDLGHQVELLVPRRFNRLKEDPFSYYGVRRNFSIRRIFCLDFTRLGRVGFLVELFSFSEFVFWKTIFQKADAYYGRDTLPLLYLSIWKKNIFWEAHKGERSFVANALLKRASKIIAISEGIKDFFVSKGVSSSKIFVIPDAVDVSLFDIETSRKEARRLLGFPQEKKIVTYSGSLSLYEWKGVDVFFEASKILEDVLFLVVGGSQEEVKKLEGEVSKNVRFVGQVPHRKIPLYLKASDVLVLPNKKGNEVSERFTSPMKLFEYMASDVPIVASRLPSIEEVVSEKEVFFFEPNNSKSLAEQILFVFGHEEEAMKKASLAKEKSKEYSWEKRVQKIVFSIKN
ncbi:MAG: glycosyltransferase family 4 protein [Patescibacteria group bacterium]